MVRSKVSAGADGEASGRLTAGVALAVIVTLGVMNRVVTATNMASTFDADETTTALMVNRTLQGHTYTYFAGQTYNGSLEQYLGAGFYALLTVAHTVGKATVRNGR